MVSARPPISYSFNSLTKPLGIVPSEPITISCSITFYCYSSSIFSHQLMLIVSHWCLSDIRSPQISRTLLNILDDLNNAAVWIVSTFPLISKSSSLCTNLIGPRAPITTAITVVFMFHSFIFPFSSKVQVLILRFAFFQLYSVVSRNSKVHNSASSLHECLGDYYY